LKKKIRGLAWIVLKWAGKVKPRVIMLENVEEFQTWGPLIPMRNKKTGRIVKKIELVEEIDPITGETEEVTKEVVAEPGETVPVAQQIFIPDKKRAGQTFQMWKSQLESLGYKIEHRELRACDYGAPTIRKRFFLVARCDGMPIKWPEPTHGDPKSEAVKNGRLKPWRTAAEIIDWDIPTKSIFGRKKPIVDNTIRRIAKGVDKFVINNPEPFIVLTNHGGEGFRGQNINDPIDTITSKHGFEVVTPILSQIGQTGGGDRLHDIQEPLSTIVSKAEHLLVTPTLIQYHSETANSSVRGQALNKPIMTLDSSPRYALSAAYLSKYYGGFYEGAGSDLNEPVHTITSTDHHALAVANICVFRNNMDGKSLDEPLPTITAGAMHLAEQATFLTKYYGQGIGQEVDTPIDTIVSKDRFGAVSVRMEKVDKSNNLGHWNKVRAMLNKYCGYNLADDEVLLLCINGIKYFISDIGLRMLIARELFNGNGFPGDYIIERDDQGKPYPQYAQVARCGNAVPPPFAEALTRANLPELCDSEDTGRYYHAI
jgi:DNA (cytosine-5)-methyltransferase 1